MKFRGVVGLHRIGPGRSGPFHPFLSDIYIKGKEPNIPKSVLYRTLYVRTTNNQLTMSLLPLLLNDICDYYRSPVEDIFDQNFGLGLLENELFSRPDRIHSMPLRSGYLRPWRKIKPYDSGLSTVQSDKTRFKVNLDVQQFKPEELKVKVEDGHIVVDGNHEERSDEHGYVSRQFRRRYKVPENVDIDALVSDLSSDGVLSIQAPKKAIEDKTKRDIPITHTNAPAIKNKQQQSEKKNGDKMEE